MSRIARHLWTLAVAAAGFCLLGFVAPNVVVETHRDAAGAVSADVSWRCAWNLITMAKAHIDDFQGAEVESLVSTRSLGDRSATSSTVRLRLLSRNESLLAQLVAGSDDVWAGERRLNAFRNCINCDAADETTIIPGLIWFRAIGAGLLLFGGSLFLIGVPLEVRRALRQQPADEEQASR